MFHHILVPLDGTAEAEYALPFAARIAHRSGATLTLLRLLPEYSAHPVLVGVGGDSRESMDSEKQRGTNDLARLCMSPLLRGLSVEKKLYTWAAAKEGEKRDEIDLIVLYEHERIDNECSILERLAHSVSRNRTVPILLLHEQEIDWQAKRKSQHPFRILVALDGSQRAEAAIQPAAMLSSLLSAPEPGSLHLLCAVHPPMVSVDSYGKKVTTQIHDKARASTQSYLERVTRKVFQAIVCNTPMRVSSSLCDVQDIADVLACASKLVSPPLSAFAFTTYDSDSCTCWLPGRDAERLLHSTRLPVLVVQPA